MSDRVQKVPDHVDMGRDEWVSLSAYQRYYYKNKEQEKKRTAERKQQIKKWFYEDFKPQFSCINCGEDHPACLEFHHREPEEKEISVTKMVQNHYSREKIKEEAEKCNVLCANCHRIKHDERYS